MIPSDSFPGFFHALWSHDPFPWQCMLADRLASGEWPKVVDLPTAAGKTACIDAAVYALAAQSDKPVWERTAPRRIWFVVDRRIVVDEAYERAWEIARKLQGATQGPLKLVADHLREISGTECPLAVARLRGGVLRDDGWARLPSQPAVITSTVDQLGSRLLFRGYGRSSLTASIFAGLAAHDSLILLDEAHLSVPFTQTLHMVERYRGDGWAEQPIRTPFAFCILSATPPAADVPEESLFPGVDRDAALDHPELEQRINASKPAELVAVKPESAADDDTFVEAAISRVKCFVQREGKRRVAVIVNRVHTAETIAKALQVQHGAEFDVVLFTGRLRPFERDQLVVRWKPVLKACRPCEPEKPVALVATQCIEVGADFSFDALVTEAASLDALRQRFGRLNRLGGLESAPATILIRDHDAKAGAEDFVYGTAMAECWRLLRDLAATQSDGRAERKIIDFGIAALDVHLQRIGNLTPYLAPIVNAPLLLPAHMDLLCQTTPIPQAEPDVQFYLHGAGRGVPEVRLVWRADLDGDDMEKDKTWPETVSLCPPNSSEMMTVPLHRLQRWLAEATSTEDDNDVEGIQDARQHDKERIRPILRWQGREYSQVCKSAAALAPNDVVVIPTDYGIAGLGQSEPAESLGSAQLDIWEPTHWRSGKPIALRLHPEVLKPWSACPPVRALLDLAKSPAWDRDSVQEAIDEVCAYRRVTEDEPSELPSWLLDLFSKVRDGRYERHPTGGLILFAGKIQSREEGEQDLFADDDDLFCATGEEAELGIHSALVERAVEKFADRCLPDAFREPLKSAAYWHDVGKLDERFQIMLRQGNELAAVAAQPLAKSAAVPDSPARWRAIRIASDLPERFRHEMLSLQLAERYLPIESDTENCDLLLHAITSHHGYGRPFAPICLDPEPRAVRGVHDGVTIEASVQDRILWPAPHALASGVSERFWRLTRRYGWWGLAYLEAILRLSDWYGSRHMIKEISRQPCSMSKLPCVKASVSKGKSIELAGIDGANPLGFLAAVGALVVISQTKCRDARLAWHRNGLAWRPQLTGLPIDDPADLVDLLAQQLTGGDVSEDSDKRKKDAEQRLLHKNKEIKDRRNHIKKHGLRGSERKQVFEEEVVPLEHEREELRKTWLEALRQSVPSPELALGSNIDCTELEYRAIAEPLMQSACSSNRMPLDMLAAFCGAGCLHESSTKRKDGKLASTPFAFISGGGHQDFLGTVAELLKCTSPQHVASTLFSPWTYEDEGLSMRWDPAEDRRYALMDRDPTASDNKPRTVWVANLLAYRALAILPSVPARRGLAAVGWSHDKDGELFFTWPLWSHPVGPDTIRSLLLLADLHLEVPSRTVLHARGVQAAFRSRRIRVGTGANFKINFSPAREV